MIRPFLFVVICATATARAADPSAVSDSGDWQDIAPNGKHFAALAVRAEDDLIWRKDIGIGVLEVVEPSTPGGKITDNPETSQYGKYVCFQLGDRAGVHAAWSPDSRYLVITTASLGGHSPWHSEAYVYCASDQSFRYMDDITGVVISSVFKFIGPHTVRMGIGAMGNDGYDLNNPKEVDVDLDQKSPAMKKQKPLASGDLSGN